MFEHVFESQTILPVPREEVFPFFSDATNLARLTPASLGFQIRSPQPIQMEEGTLIDYTIKLHGLPMRWRTKITQWNPPIEFIDEQLKGPYRTWIHHHIFEDAADGQTLMRDRVRYSLPFPPFGQIALPFVRAEIDRIFSYREKILEEIFPPTK